MTSIAKMIGRERFMRRLRRLPQAVREEVRASLAQSAEDLVQSMRARAPVKTGTLKSSIKWRWGGKKRRGDERDNFTVTIYVDKPAHHYAHLVEFGVAPHENKGRFAGTQNPGQPPEPYFFPTYRAKKRTIKNRTRAAIRKAVKKTKGA